MDIIALTRFHITLTQATNNALSLDCVLITLAMRLTVRQFVVVK